MFLSSHVAKVRITRVCNVFLFMKIFLKCIKMRIEVYKVYRDGEY